MITHNNGIKQSLQQQQTILPILENKKTINNTTDNNNMWKICTLNVRGINDPGKFYTLNDWIQQNNFDFTFITETKLSSTYRPKFNLENTQLTAYYEATNTHHLGQGIIIIMKNT